MQVIAVIQLDRIFEKLSNLDSREVLQVVSRQFGELRRCRLVDQWISMLGADAMKNFPADLTQALGTRFVVNHAKDPLDEFYQIASVTNPQSDRHAFDPVVVRLVPSLRDPDPDMIDSMIDNHRSRHFDYSRSALFDDGQSPVVEIMNFSALDEAWREALLPDDREFITPYIYRQNQRFNIGTYSSASSASGGGSATQIFIA